MKRAEKVPAPPLEDLFNDVYESQPWHLQEQQAALEQHIRKYPDAYKKTAWRFGNE
jgi:2-oxoisovalerate dehydrogenase E1 component alpha subunit